MKLDEFAFVNRQLAAMLRDGIPLEGALRRLSETMARGDLREELEKLEADLASGAPLSTALKTRRLPRIYGQMLQLGVKSGDLPGVLTLLADYYEQANGVWARLRAIMIYPLIVLGGCLGLSVFLAHLFTVMQSQQIGIFNDLLGGGELPALTRASFLLTPVCLWAPVVVIALIAIACVFVAGHPGMRQWLRWHLPGWREVSLWQVASLMALMLRSGCGLEESIALMAEVEGGSPAAKDLRQWEKRLANGEGKFAEFAKSSAIFPPLFVWLVAVESEDLVAGFARAAEIYHGRASRRVEMMLYAALPVSVLFLGGLIFSQVFTLVLMIISNFLPMVMIN